MNQTEAQQFLNDNGPWNIKLDGSEFVFENGRGDVVTADIYTSYLYGYESNEVQIDFTVGVRV